MVGLRQRGSYGLWTTDGVAPEVPAHVSCTECLDLAGYQILAMPDLQASFRRLLRKLHPISIPLWQSVQSDTAGCRPHCACLSSRLE